MLNPYYDTLLYTNQLKGLSGKNLEESRKLAALFGKPSQIHGYMIEYNMVANYANTHTSSAVNHILRWLGFLGNLPFPFFLFTCSRVA